MLREEDRERIESAGLIKNTSLELPVWFDDFLRDKRAYYREFYIPKTEMRKMLAAGHTPTYPRNRIPADKQHLWRRISAPVRCLMELQRRLMYVLYGKHPSKFDFCISGKNRFDAMRQLAGFKVIIAADIKDAFPSTSTWQVEQTLKREGFNHNDARSIAEAATFNGCLPQGSPCSPVLLNLCRKRLDYRLAGYVEKKYGGVTAVYVDNYYFGSNEPNFNRCIGILKKIAQQTGYEFPDKKIYIMRQGGRQCGLGLVTSRVDGIPIVQPDKKQRKRLKAILHNGLKRVQDDKDLDPWDDLTLMQVRGMVECYKGSIYYERFRGMVAQINEIIEYEEEEGACTCEMCRPTVDSTASTDRYNIYANYNGNTWRTDGG